MAALPPIPEARQLDRDGSPHHAQRRLVDPAILHMSRFKGEVAHLQAHVKSLRLAVGAVFVVALLAVIGWWQAPRDLTIHIPPDLRSGSTEKWWAVPPESVYTFAFYVFQQLNRWPANGAVDYPRNIHALSPYFTPACESYLKQDEAYRLTHDELRGRVRGVYEIPGKGYGENPTKRVTVISDNDWIVTLDLVVDESLDGELVKRAFVRYPLRVIRYDVDPQRNPWGLVIDCFAHPPEEIPMAARPAPRKGGFSP